MQAHRIETTVQQDGKLVIQDIPFQAGDVVEVIILSVPKLRTQDKYPLQGTVLEYLNPTEPVASDDWEANT
jgi:hypothetical protein